MLAWRKTHKIPTLLNVPQPDFYDIMELFPHAIHGQSITEDNCYVVYVTRICEYFNSKGYRGYVVCLELWLFVDSSVLLFYCRHVPLLLVH